MLILASTTCERGGTKRNIAPLIGAPRSLTRCMACGNNCSTGKPRELRWKKEQIARATDHPEDPNKRMAIKDTQEGKEGERPNQSKWI